MAVMVERQQYRCPNCNELLSYTSADVRIRKHDKNSFYYENGKEYPMITTDVWWYLTCPTCKNVFNVAKFSRYQKL